MSSLDELGPPIGPAYVAPKKPVGGGEPSSPIKDVGQVVFPAVVAGSSKPRDLNQLSPAAQKAQKEGTADAEVEFAPPQQQGPELPPGTDPEVAGHELSRQLESAEKDLEGITGEIDAAKGDLAKHEADLAELEDVARELEKHPDDPALQARFEKLWTAYSGEEPGGGGGDGNGGPGKAGAKFNPQNVEKLRQSMNKGISKDKNRLISAKQKSDTVLRKVEQFRKLVPQLAGHWTSGIRAAFFRGPGVHPTKNAAPGGGHEQPAAFGLKDSPVDDPAGGPTPGSETKAADKKHDAEEAKQDRQEIKETVVEDQQLRHHVAAGQEQRVVLKQQHEEVVEKTGKDRRIGAGLDLARKVHRDVINDPRHEPPKK